MENSVGGLLSLLAIPAAAGAAWAGVKSGLNGARQSIHQIERIVTRLDEKVDKHGEKISALGARTENFNR